MQSALQSHPSKPIVVYPESDGKSMADNTKQFRWIQVLQGNLAAKYRDEPDVFVAGDLLWYPVEGEPRVRAAPDVMVAFGRPKRDRGSYRQWEEGDVAPQVVFEVLSPGNDAFEMADKSFFYSEHGVEEYYLYDPDLDDLHVYTRKTALLKRVYDIDNFVSPRLGIRFDLSGDVMSVLHADGRRFLTFEELEDERAKEQQRADKAEERADSAEQRAARLSELALKVLSNQATDEEKAELARLAAPSF